MDKTEVVDMLVRRLNPVVTGVSVHDQELGRTAVDFEYRFSSPREFKSSVIVSESGSVSRLELRLPAVRQKDCDIDDVPKRYTEMEIHEKTERAVEKLSFPRGTKIEINTDLDDVTFQPHVVCDNPSVVPQRIAPSVANLPDAYLERVPEHHHVYDNTK